MCRAVPDEINSFQEIELKRINWAIEDNKDIIETALNRYRRFLEGLVVDPLPSAATYFMWRCTSRLQGPIDLQKRYYRHKGADL